MDAEGTTGRLASRDTPAGPVVSLEGGRLELTGLRTMRRTSTAVAGPRRKLSKTRSLASCRTSCATTGHHAWTSLRWRG